jgi:hypothetical protein
MSALGPIDPSCVHKEDEKEAAWIVRKLAGVNASAACTRKNLEAYSRRSL